MYTKTLLLFTVVAILAGTYGQSWSESTAHDDWWFTASSAPPASSTYRPIRTTVAPTTANPIPTTVSTADPRCPENCEYRSVGCECSIFYQCRNGTYTEYICPAGLHFNKLTLQCDIVDKAGCSLNPTECCECVYIPKGSCSSGYIFQDHNRNVTSYEGDHHCIRENRQCSNGLVWNPAANGADGACDFKTNVPACSESETTTSS